MGVSGTVTFSELPPFPPDPGDPYIPFWRLSFEAALVGPGFKGTAYRLDPLEFEMGGTFPFGYGMETRGGGMQSPLFIDPHPDFLAPVVVLAIDVEAEHDAIWATDLTVDRASGQVWLQYFYEPRAAVPEPTLGALIAIGALALMRLR
jgi:hypothetical protein